jgi:hypothetical protein
MSVIIFSLISSNGLSNFPLGRDHDYQVLNTTFAVNVVKFGTIIGLFPKFLKPCVFTLSPCSLVVTKTHSSIVSRMLSNLPSQIRQEIEFIRPMAEERFAKMEEYGEDWDDKPVRRTIVSGIFLITRVIHRTIC